MLLKNTLLSLTLLSTGFTACGVSESESESDSDTPLAVEDAADEELLGKQPSGTWIGGTCNASLPVVMNVTFTRTTVTDEFLFYSSDCTAIDYKYEYTYPYRIGATSAPFTYDMGKLLKMKVSALSEDGAHELNASREETDWIADDSREYSFEPSQAFITFDILKIEDGHLYFGKTLDEDGEEIIPGAKTSPDSRPTEFERSSYAQSPS